MWDWQAHGQRDCFCGFRKADMAVARIRLTYTSLPYAPERTHHPEFPAERGLTSSKQRHVLLTSVHPNSHSMFPTNTHCAHDHAHPQARLFSYNRSLHNTHFFFTVERRRRLSPPAGSSGSSCVLHFGPVVSNVGVWCAHAIQAFNGGPLNRVPSHGATRLLYLCSSIPQC